MKYLVYVPEVYHTAFEIEASSFKEAFLKAINDDPSLKQVGSEYSHTLVPEPVPDQVMWEVQDENGDSKMFIDDEGTSDSDF